jgi:hypothetical protein
MIEVIIRDKGSEIELGRIEIENISAGLDHANYSVRFAVERVKGVGIHQRGILNFPRKKYNVLALLLQALNTLDPSDLELDGNIGEGLPRRKKLPWRGEF